MSKDNFQWDDAKVWAFGVWYRDNQLASLSDSIEKFKASHQPIPKMSREMFSTEPRGNHFGFDEPQEPSKPEKDWKITKYLQVFDDGSEFVHDATIDCPNNGSCKINSVKRLSDGEVFSVGDETNFGRILGFEIRDEKMVAHYYGLGNWQWLRSINKPPPQPKPLFTTSDGVPKYLMDGYFSVSDEFYLCYSHAHPEHIDEVHTKRTFSTKEKAEEYILWNKPMFTLKEFIDKVFLKEETIAYFKQLANNKIKQQ